MMKIVLKLDIHDRRQGNRALKAVASLHGFEQVSVDTREGKMTVVGTGVDPVAVVGKLRKWRFPNAIILSVGPAKEQPAKRRLKAVLRLLEPYHKRFLRGAHNWSWSTWSNLQDTQPGRRRGQPKLHRRGILRLRRLALPAPQCLAGPPSGRTLVASGEVDGNTSCLLPLAREVGVRAAVGAGTNFVVSPLSIHAALALVTVGTRRDTRRELLGFLGSASLDDLYRATATELVGRLNGLAQTSFACGVWFDRRRALRPGFTVVPASRYATAVESVDFVSGAEQARRRVNAFVANATSSLPAPTKLGLTTGMQDNGECIAVKKLHLMPGLDDVEFKNEFNNLVRVRHQNIILLVGYCHHTAQVPVEHNGEHVSARVEERALCSEYLRGGSLDTHLANELPCAFAWHTCYKIIKGICEGLCYLHEGFEYPIYHLELKPTIFLLDKDMMPKIGVFGFSRLFDSTETLNTSEVTGTSVYMPPEYISKRQITPKFDVFSLGIIILQIMAGKESYTKCADIPPEEYIELVCASWENRMHATISRHTSREVRTCIKIALKCVEFNRWKRPTINEVIEELNKIVECSFESSERITNGFSKENIVGRGGYGTIYKGVQDNGEEIAFKRLHSHSMPWIDDEQFKNELDNLMRVQHKNIVRLVGYCYHTTQVPVEYKGELVQATVVERAICLEYMQGGSP